MASMDRRSSSPYTRSDDTDFAHTGPGTLAGRYLRSYWQPVYVADALQPGRAVPLQVMGEQFTLYRGESGTPHLVASRCAHRGTQLSTGWVEADCIRCFYHGWKYDGSGQCVEQPAEDSGFAQKVRIHSYPVQEYLGLIFAYLGESEAPSLPRYPELEAPGALEIKPYIRLCNYFQNLENILDEVHIAFTHRQSGFSEYGLNFDLPKVDAEETEYGFVLTGTRSSDVARVTHFLMPNARYLKAPPEQPEETEWRDSLAWRVPIDDEHHQVYIVDLLHVSDEGARHYRERQQHRPIQHSGLPSAREIVTAVLAGDVRIQDILDRPDIIIIIQDHVTQEGQGAIADRTRDRLGRSDLAVILLRKAWTRELQALAEERPLKQWRRPEQLATTSGV